MRVRLFKTIVAHIHPGDYVAEKIVNGSAYLAEWSGTVTAIHNYGRFYDLDLRDGSSVPNLAPDSTIWIERTYS